MKTEIIQTVALVLTFLLLLLCFNILHHRIENSNNQYKKDNTKLIERIDSLENELNTFYKEKQDTIIVEVVPSDIKIYPKIYTN